MIKQTIVDQIKDAMRAHRQMELGTLRYILSQIKYKEIDKKRELHEDEVIDVLSSEVKKRRDAIKLFKDSGRDELVTEEEKKLVVITSLLPAQMSEEEVASLVELAIQKVGRENMGLVIKEVIPQVKGRADGSMVSRLVKEKMSAAKV